jgi:5'-nucleotidase/UDP-sugar diphosphatase
MLPFDNTVVVLTMKGSEVLSLFDYIANVASGRGAFPQVSEGLRFTIDYAAGKCVNIFINGQPINAQKTYKIATNSYLANGGDGYKVFLKALGRYESSMFQRDIFVEHIKSLGGRIRPVLKGRIKVRYGGGASIRLKRAA